MTISLIPLDALFMSFFSIRGFLGNDAQIAVVIKIGLSRLLVFLCEILQ